MGTIETTPRLLAGPAPAAGAERLRDHLDRLGALPPADDRGTLVATIERSGLLGRGGAGFPVGRKWRAIAERARGRAVVVVNGAEGEPRSAKDRVLMTYRPQLVLDGALLAAEAVGAEQVVVYVGEEHAAARASMRRAIEERRDMRPRFRLVAAPAGYVSGEASAAVSFIERGVALPTAAPPRPSEAGVGGRPTLVQNVESLACAALIARFGDDWYRSAGRSETPGTALVTVTGAGRPGVREIELGTPLRELAAQAGIAREAVGAVLLGGYFGAWSRLADAWDLPLDPVDLRGRGLAFGCGMVSFLEAGACGVRATAWVMSFLAAGSAGQCGPCVFGLRAIADTTADLAAGRAGAAELDHVERWTGRLAGRGACHHPDGAAALMGSALDVFGDEFAYHARTGGCSAQVADEDVA